ncbi:MAG: hypothetical protein EXR71_18020 [Myxococcales bacterium]|nr:hypothetical protein [Myxococcales bacterium]
MDVGTHFVFRSEDRRVLAATPARQRAFAAALCQVGERHGLYAFGLGDTHGHAALTTRPAAVGQFVHDARLVLSSVLETRMGSPAVFPIEDGRHAQRLIAYVHGQDDHHGVGLDPWREGTSLPDLLGLRVTAPWLIDRVRAIAPRLRRSQLWQEWGREETEAVELSLLAEAAAAAVGCPALSGNTPAVVSARIAAIAAAGSLGTGAVAVALGLTARAVQRLRARPASPQLVRAIRLQCGLRLHPIGPALLGEARVEYRVAGVDGATEVVG